MNGYGSQKRIPHLPVWLVLFFASGAAGLIYEILWVKSLTLLVGVTTFAVSAVVAAFMFGLAVGSHIFGRIADRVERPMMLYAVLELLIGIYGACFPWIAALLEQVYISAYHAFGDNYPLMNLIRFAAAFVVLSIPTTLMGGTLPLVGRALVSAPKSGHRVLAVLYGVNTLGGVVGCALAGFALIPVFGMRWTLGLAVAVNALVGAIAFCISGRISKPRVHIETEKAEEPRPRQTSQGRLAVTAFCVSGFCAIGFQILWTRFLIHVLGSSVYTFTIILTTFLIGIAIGSWLFSMKYFHRRNPVSVLGGLLGITGLWSIVAIPIMGLLPYAFIRAFELFDSFGRSWSLFAFLQFGIVASIILPPTLCMGATFPTVMRALALRSGDVGRSIGRAYAWNTIGAILGSFAAGFAIIPLFGVQKGIAAVAALEFIVALLLFISTRRKAVPIFAAALFLAAVGWAFAGAESWNRDLLTCDIFVDPDEGREALVGKYEAEADFMDLFYEEGVSSTVRVTKGPFSISLNIDGRTNASLNDADTQRLLGYIPAFMHGNPKKSLVIGLGCGMTAGTLAEFPAMERVDVVELSPEVYRAAAHFEPYTHNVLHHPKVRRFIADGRNFLLASEEKYDLISSEPANLWVSGVSNLFSQEFFQLCDARLKPGGVLMQWVHLYNLDPQILQSFFRTLLSVFPHACGFLSLSGDLLIAASMEPIEKSLDDIEKWWDHPIIREEMQQLGFKNAEALFSAFILSENDMARIGRDAPVNSDNHPVIEYLAPRVMYSSDLEENLLFLLERRKESEPPILWASDEERSRILALIERSLKIWRLYEQYQGETDPDEEYRLISEAAALNPAHDVIRNDYVLQLIRREGPEAAIEASEKILAENPHYTGTHYFLAELYLSLGQPDKAYPHCLAISSFYAADGPNLAAECLLRMGEKLETALELSNRAIAVCPQFGTYRLTRAYVLAALNEPEKARRAALRAAELNPGLSRSVENLLDAIDQWD